MATIGTSAEIHESEVAQHENPDIIRTGEVGQGNANIAGGTRIPYIDQSQATPQRRPAADRDSIYRNIQSTLANLVQGNAEPGNSEVVATVENDVAGNQAADRHAASGMAPSAGMPVSGYQQPAQRPAMADRQQVQGNVKLADISNIDQASVLSARPEHPAPASAPEQLGDQPAPAADLDLTPPEPVAGESAPVSAGDDADIERRRQAIMHKFIKGGGSFKNVLRYGNVNKILGRSLDLFAKHRQQRFAEPSSKRPTSLEKTLKNRSADAFKNLGVGHRVYGKMHGLPSLDLRDIGIGMQEMSAAIEQNPAMIQNLIKESTGVTDDITMWSASQITEFFDTHEVYVATFKPPNNRGQDIQRRRLRVLSSQQRGIWLHPLMAAMYTADFDGDDMEVSFDHHVAEYASDPMEHMIGVDGKISLDIKFLANAQLVDGYQKGKTAYNYIREVIFYKFPGLGNSEHIDELCNAVLKLTKTVNLKEDEQEAAWIDVIQAARKVSDTVYTKSRTMRNKLMSDLCRAVCDNLRAVKVQHSLSDLDADIVGADGLPSPRSYDDSIAYVLIRQISDDISRGMAPRNFQDFKVMLNGFIGNVEGKNAPFRFTADVGKILKIDDRLQIGDGTYVISMNNRKQAKEFFEKTMKYAQSLQMQKEVKKEGRAQYYTEVMRSRVIKDVGFPDDPRYNGNFSAFLAEFARMYQVHSGLINMANLTYLSTMAISHDSNRELVSPLKLSGPHGTPTYSDLAEPMLSIYGTYSIERMFKNLQKRKIMTDSIDTEGGKRRVTDMLWAGNPDARPERFKSGGAWKERPLHINEHEYEKYYIEEEVDGIPRNIARFWISGKYLSYNLRQFAHNNRLVRGTRSDVSKLIDVPIYGELKPGTGAEWRMLYAIADKRTGSASRYNQAHYGFMSREDADESRGRKAPDKTTVDMMSEALEELNRILTDETLNERYDLTRWAEDIANLLICSGPDMFNYFGMDSPAGFLESELCKKMLEHRGDREVLGGIRTAMVFRYRMSHILELQSQISNPDEGVDLVNLMNEWEFAVDELAAASPVWHGIIMEMKAEDTDGMDSVFHAYTSNFLPTARGAGGHEYDWAPQHLDAESFWKDPGDHTSLKSVIQDLDLDRATKWRVIADVVRYWENDLYIKPYEIGFQMEIGSDSSYAIGAPDTQSALKVFRDFEKQYNRWSSMRQEVLQENIDNAARKWEGDKGSLIDTLKYLDESPWELVAIDDGMYADSLMSVLDKTYAQTEKSSQNPWTNLVYAALSFQRLGGYHNDIERTDDRVLGVQSAEGISALDIVHILSDPEASLTVYNQYGEYAVLTREKLLTSALNRELGDVEQDIWEFLKTNPRIATAIRRHNACAMANSDGKGYVGASLSTVETIERFKDASDPIGHVKYLMRDHPVYAAIISMSMPMRGAVARNHRSKVIIAENYIAGQILAYASRDSDPYAAARSLLEDIDITELSILTALNSDYDSFIERMGLPTSTGLRARSWNDAKENAKFTYDVAVSNLAHYIEEVRGNVHADPLTVLPDKPSGLFGVDTSSVASFWDVCQELSGAKTGISTGIEGAETYNYAEWSSHIGAKDHYADLQAVREDIDETWNGAWTSLVNSDGTPVLLEFDSSGYPSLVLDGTRYSDFGQALKAAKSTPRGYDADEIVVRAPDQYTVKDRSTDSYGKQISSLGAYMVSKRSNGAEAFNLQWKKAGYDGKDTIVKMKTRHRQVFDEASNSYRDVTFEELQNEYSRIAEERGLAAAQIELAKLLLKENRENMYNDLTLSNYMCLAELMLIQGQDGAVHLRSLEMLFTAIKYRIGGSVDDLDEDELRKAVGAVVNDSSETGVGIAQISAIDALQSFQPRPKAGPVNGIRLKSSTFARNFDLLEDIAKKAAKNNVVPLTPQFASELDRMNRGVDGIKQVAKRSMVARNYSIVGYAGANKRRDEIHYTVGPSNAIVVGPKAISKATMNEITKKAWMYGMTVIVSAEHLNLIPQNLIKDAVPCSDYGDVLIPMFDMRLNGAEASPYIGGRFNTYQAPFSRFVVSVEDRINEFNLGDAMVACTKALVDRIHNVETGSVPIKAEDLFPNVYKNGDYRRCHKTVSLSSGTEIANLIMGGVKCSIDYGIVEGARGWDQRRHDVDAAIERYRSRWQEADADGIIRGGAIDCVPGDIVGWATCKISDPITGAVEYALAPIIPFPLHGAKKTAPQQYRVEQLGFADEDHSLMSIDWSNTSDVREHTAKFFNSSGAADKGMVNFADAIQDTRLLKDGTAVDVYIAKESMSSRRIGTDRRIKTMVSLMTLARMHGYNFADAAGSFPLDEAHPENAYIKDALRKKPLYASEWAGWLANGRQMLFTSDRWLNAFLNYECRKILADGGNPSHYLACVFDQVKGNTHVMWEFEAMFDSSLNYEDGLLRFLHSMDSSFCPNGIEDETQDCYFRLARDGDGLAQGYDTGVLEMQAPHRLANGSTAYIWSTVYIGMSFFGEDYSGFSRPNIDGASNFLDAMNTMSHYGMLLDRLSSRIRAVWATSDIGRRMRSCNALSRA